MLNPTNANSGSKIHMHSYFGVITLPSGRLQARKRVNTMGPQQTACKMYKDGENYMSFHEIVKSHPQDCCKKCQVEYRRLVSEQKAAMKKQAQK